MKNGQAFIIQIAQPEGDKYAWLVAVDNCKTHQRITLAAKSLEAALTKAVVATVLNHESAIAEASGELVVPQQPPLIVPANAKAN